MPENDNETTFSKEWAKVYPVSLFKIDDKVRITSGFYEGIEWTLCAHYMFSNIYVVAVANMNPIYFPRVPPDIIELI